MKYTAKDIHAGILAAKGNATPWRNAVGGVGVSIVVDPLWSEDALAVWGNEGEAHRIVKDGRVRVYLSTMPVPGETDAEAEHRAIVAAFYAMVKQGDMVCGEE